MSDRGSKGAVSLNLRILRHKSFSKSEHYFYFKILILEIQCSQCKAPGRGRLGICYDLSQFYLHSVLKLGLSKSSAEFSSVDESISTGWPAQRVRSNRKATSLFKTKQNLKQKNQNECQIFMNAKLVQPV